MSILAPIILKTIVDVAGPVIAGKVRHKIAANPVAVNELNAEKPYQSRVAHGGTMAFLPAAGYLVYAASVYGADISKYLADPVMLVAIPAAWGGFYALYGRFKGGLKPLFSRGK